MFRQTSPVWFQVFGPNSGSVANGPILFNTNGVGTAISNYSSTNGRFTPTTAGIYIFTSTVYATTAGSMVYIYKNGSIYISIAIASDTLTHAWYNVSGIVILNGTSDYVTVEISNTSSATINNVFTGCLLIAT